MNPKYFLAAYLFAIQTFFECQPHVKQHVARNKLATIPALPSSSSHSQSKTDM